jgi:hypothetical protein
MFVALGVQRVLSMRHIVICGLPHSIILFHFILSKARLSKKKIENKICVSIFSTSFA